MALPQEQLDKMREQIETAETGLAGAQEIVDDMVGAGLDATVLQEDVTRIKADIAKLRAFYDRQLQRTTSQS